MKKNISTSTYLFVSLLTLCAGSFAAYTYLHAKEETQTSATSNPVEAITFAPSETPQEGTLTSTAKLAPVKEAAPTEPASEIAMVGSAPVAKPVSKVSRSVAQVKEVELEQKNPDQPAKPKRSFDKMASFVSFTPDFFSTKLNSQDIVNGTHANLLSKANLGFNLDYAQIWNKKFFSQFYFGLQNVTFNQPNSAITLNTNSAALYRFGVRGNYKFSENGVITLGVGSEQNIYLRSIAPTQVALETVASPKFSLSSSFRLLEVDPFSLGAAVGFSLSAPTSTDNYQTKWNAAYFAKAFVSHQVSETFHTETGISGQYQNLNSSIVNQSQTDYGVYFRVIWFFSERKKERE